MPYYTRKGTSKKDKGKICVYKKEDNTKVGCTAGPIEKYLGALHASEKVNEANDFDWLKEPIQIKYGDLMDNLQQFFKVGDTIYLTGGLALNVDGSIFIPLNNAVTKVDAIEGKRLKVSFGEDITELPIWQSEMSSNYVHLGDVVQDNEVMVVFPEKRINESKDFEWVSEIGGDIEKFIQELSRLIKQHVPVAELELDWDTTSGGGEYFGRIWLYDTFYELYKYGKTFTVRFYRLDPETDEYYQFDSYEGLPQPRLLTILLNDMIRVNKKNLNESDEDPYKWIKDVEMDELSASPDVFFRSDDEMFYTLDQLGFDVEDMDNGTMAELAINTGYRWSDKHNGWYHRDEVGDFNRLRESEEGDIEWLKGPAQVKFGDIKHNITDYLSIGDTIHLSGPLYLDEDSYEKSIILNNEPGVIVSFVDSISHPKMDVSFGENITTLPLWADSIGVDYIDLGAFETDDDILIILPEKSDINESNEDEMDWVRGVELDLVPGEIYDIKTGNGYYWVPEIYVGKKWDNEHQIEMYKFKDLDGGGSGSKSVPYVKDLIEKGNIRPYNPDWSIKDELTFSDNIEDALKGGFVIYFKNGVYLDQTLPIQDKLFEMGFSFYTKGPNEYITNEDSPKKIQFFESFNWDTSNPRYNKMPSDQWDKKKVLLMSVDEDKGRWRSKSDPRLEEQELFLTVRDHNATVINGDKYMIENINETDTSVSSGVFNGPIQLGLKKWDNSSLAPFTDFANTKFNHSKKQKTLKNNIKRSVGIWEKNKKGSYDMNIHDVHTINESDEFDWIQKQEPEKELKKSKKYVIDVSNLRSAPMRYSHDPSLTKQDILRKLEDLGYDVQHIDVDAAKYFYVEPTDGGPSWQYDEYGTPIQYDYWVDYNTDLMDDPTYGGKYQMINVDEFMFLIDNNLIGESEEDDLGWMMDTIPSKKDKLDFYKTTLDYGNNVNVGDEFIPSGGNIIWTVEEKTENKNEPGYYTIKLRSENNKLKFYTWNPNYEFPTSYKPWKKIVGTVNESEDEFDWVRDIMSEPITVCDAYEVLKPGENIMINHLNEWESSRMVENITAQVLAIAPCKEIQPSNISRDTAILIHVNDDYEGFDEGWVRDFKPEYIDDCLDGRCMFLICDDNDEDVMITIMDIRNIFESKNSINEVAGISFESRKWADIIYNEIISNPEEQTRLIIDGYDHPEAFNGFPIDYVVIDYYDKITGYGQEHSGYDKDGNYVVLLYVQPQLVRGQGGYSLKSALNHEMKHAWEDYNRLSKGLPSIEQTKESKQLYNRDFILLMSDNTITGPIKDILKYFYYLSSLETSPYLENVYDENPAYENMVRQIATKDFESFKNRFDLDINWHLINTAYNIPFVKKFKSPRDFIDYSAEELRSRANKVIKKINKMKYIHNKI